MPTEDKATRKLSAILSADVKGYSILMADDEAHTIQTLKAYRRIIKELISEYSGRVVDAPGDNILAEFKSAVNAVECSVKIQKKLDQENSKFVEEKKVQFRIGVNIGDVVQDGDRIYGNGVNVAARIEGLADPGGVCISRNAFDHIKSKLTLGYEYIGEHAVKNIKDPVRVYKLLMADEDAGKLIGDVPKRVTKNWLYATAVLALIVITSVVWQVYQRMVEPEFEPAKVEEMAYQLPENPSIAVLAFDNMSGDREQEYFSDGISEEIITALSKTDKLFVIARNSTFTYKGKPVKIKQVAEELGVRYVLEGSVRKTENRVRITAQLIDAISGHHLWAERYDRDIKNIFEVQDEITMKIVTALQVELTEGEQARMWAGKTKNLDFRFKHMEALSLWRKGTQESLERYGEIAQEMIKMEPENSLGYRILAWYNWGLATMGKSPKESNAKAFKLAQKALSLDESDAYSHGLLGSVYLLMKQHEEAISEGKRSIELYPNGAMLHGLLGNTLSYAGMPDEAIRYLNQGIRLDPFPAYWFFMNLGRCYLLKGQYEDALTAYKKALHRAPNALNIHLSLAVTYALLDRQEEAEAAAKKALELNPNYSVNFYLQWAPYKNQADLKLIENAMRKAGLPEYPPGKKQSEKPSIAVLPFVNMSSDAEQDFFADGMTDELLTNLSKISGLLVISRNSSFVYKGKTVPIKQVANELKVKYVLEGSIQRVGNRVRIRAQLIDGTTDHHIWAESYDAIMEDIFDLQDKITKNIASVLAVKLTTKEQNRLAAKETANIEAYDAFVKGWEHLLRETPDALEQAISFFKEAVELDPMYSRAQAALAWAYLSSSLRLKWQDLIEHHDRLRLMARKHLELAMRNPTSTAHLVASKMALFRRKYEESIAHAELALAYDTNDPESNLNMALVLMATGKPEEGLEFVNKTLQLDPRNMGAPLAAAGMAYFILGDLQKAATMTERAIDHNPTIAGRYEILSAIYALLGRIQDAQVAHHESLKEMDFGRFPANLTTIMTYFLVKDRQVADTYADGLIKAGWLGSPSGYYKIYEENRLTGEEIRNLVLGKEITIHEFDRIYWIDHSIKGRAKDISRIREGKWWIEDDMLCYQMESGTVKGLKDCGEIYRNPDSLPGSGKQYLNVKDYSIAALTVKE